jgi:hypothetical protein
MKDYLAIREKLAAASRTFMAALGIAGYDRREIAEYGYNLAQTNQALSAWAIHYHKMIEDAAKTTPGTAREMAKRAIQELQDKGILDLPGVYHAAPDDEPEHEPAAEPTHHEPEPETGPFELEPEPAPDEPDGLVQPGVERKAQQLDIFGNHVVEKPKRKSGPRKKKQPKDNPQQRSLF